MNLSIHRLNDLSELEPFKDSMGWNNFYKYSIKVYRLLASLEDGQRLYYQRFVKKKNIPLFIKVVCLYIHDFPGQVLFSDDFNYIIKKNVHI